MRRFFLLAAAALSLLALVACTSKEGGQASPTAPVVGGAWQREWDQVLEAAKREGKVAVAGPAGTDLRRALTEPFERKHGISVEFLGGPGPEVWPKMKAEREAGQYLWDIWIGGTSTHLFQFKPAGALDPFDSALIVPEVTDPKNWFGGQLPYADKDHTSFLMTLGSIAAFGINTSLVKAEEFKSYRDLLDPKWKGKIVIFDPRIAGAGLAALTYYYQSKDLGPDFIRALAKQEPALTRDYRQHLEWLGQGRYLVAIGVHGGIAKELKQAGAPIKQVDPAQMKEGGFLASAIGTIGLMNRAPHPNAAKVYVNWLLSKEGQIGFSRAAAYASTRVDVPTDQLEPWELPKLGFFNIDTEEARTLETRTVGPFAKEVFGE